MTSKPKVLIADDDPMYRTLLKRQVEQWGYDVQCVDDGVPAWKLLREDESPARIAILDWQMKEMDGIELCRKIKADDNRAFTFVVILTSRSSQEDMLQGIDSGADDFLSKPVDGPLLKSRLTVARRIIDVVHPKDQSKPNVPGYQLHEMIGKGAFATVWRATSQSTNDEFALKVLPVDLCTDRALRRFEHEITLLGRLEHPNLAKIHNSNIDDKIAFYAMDLFREGTLDEYVRRTNAKGMEIIDLVCKVLEGLSCLHENGIIHRDLKTSNIMVDDDGEPRIVDFGLGKSVFQSMKIDPEMTLDQAVMGTPLFMSPEQARGEFDRVDQRSDIYAVAVILYVLLLKRHPRDIESKEFDDLGQLLDHLSLGEITEPRKVHPRFNKALQQIILKGLARDPDDRYQTADRFLSDVRVWRADRVKSAVGS